MTFLGYCKEHRKAFALGVSFALIFLGIFGLYHLPLIAVVYPCVLCTALCFSFCVYDYQKERKHIEKIRHLQRAPQGQMYAFEDTKTQLEASYQELVIQLQKELSEHSFVTDEKYHQMMDYYTMWVHQIKTPIASMRLTLETMDSTEARKLMADLLRIEQYVNMVLTYLRLDSESSDYVFREYTIDELVKPAIRKFASEFIGRKLSFSYEGIEQKIITDEKWFSFVLEQVLSNALKYTKEGGISIYLQDSYLVIEDTGIGISQEDLPRIFEKGFTGFNGRMDHRASGIGLFLCKRICEKLRLPIVIESSVSKGTKVKIGIVQDNLTVKD